MNLRPFVLCLFTVAAWLWAPELAAQWPGDGHNGGGVTFATPAEADRAFGAAADLPTRSRLLLPVAETYLRAHRFGDLTAKLAAAETTPADASWQRGFLLAQLHAQLGNAGEATSLLKELPEEATRDPVVLQFRLAHPELIGEPPARATATLVEIPTTPGERVAMVGVLLDAMKPELALEIIAAHPDDLWDEPDVLSRFSPQFADLGLVPRLTPLLAARVERRPDDWRTRLFLAHFQLLASNTAAARDHLQRIQDQKDDASGGDRSPTLPERVAALDGFTLWSMGQPQGGRSLRPVATLRQAQDVAMICFGGWAAERGEGARFLHDLKARCHGDDAGWLAALMLLDSQGLVLRELSSQLARGTPPDLISILASGWLNAHQSNRQGMNFSGSGRGRLRAAYAKLAQSAKPIPSAPGQGQDPAPSANRVNSPAADLAVALRTGDPADKARVLARLEESPNATAALWEISRLLNRRPASPEDEAVIQTLARLLVKAAAQTDDRIIAQKVLRPALPWTAMLPRPDWNRRGMGPNWPGGALPFPPGKPPSPNEEVAAAFFAQSAALPWQSPSWRSFPFSPENMPAALPAALAQLSVDPGAPDHAAARTAEAYALSQVPGQGDRAIEMLRRVTGGSPSYVARFWLVALLAERGWYAEAEEVLASCDAVPGYFTTFLQGGAALLQRAARGEPLFQSAGLTAAPPPAAGRKVPNTATELLYELRRLVSEPAANDPATAGPALAIADQLSTFRPAETLFPERLEVLRAYQRFGKLADQIAVIEERTRRYPASADAWLALGDALSLADPSRPVPAYETAFALAPDRPDIAEKVVSARFPTEVRVDAYCVLLRKDAMKTITSQPNLLATFQQTNAWPRFIAAFGQGFNQWGRRQLGGSGQWDAMLRGIRQTAGDEAAIGLLTAMCKAPGPQSSYDAAPENSLIALLTGENRTEEITAVVDGVLFPSETIHGLDVDGGPLMALLNPPSGLEFLAKVNTSEGLSRLKAHARRLMAERPGDSRAPLVLMTLLIVERNPNLSAELLPCLQALREDRDDDRQDDDLASLAQMASVFPAGRPATWDLLAEVRRRRAGKPAERATLEQIARTALDLGDQERAWAALRELLVMAKSRKFPSGTRELTGELCLMARAGMEPEATELATLTFYPMAPAGPDDGRVLASSFPLTYLEACAESGRPEFGATVLPEFLRRLVVDAGNKSNQPRFPMDYPARVVEALVTLNLADGARSALKTLEGSWQTSASADLRRAVEKAGRFLARTTGETGAPPVAFLDSFTPAGELTGWWDLAAMGEPANGAGPTQVSLLGTDLPSLAGRYSVQILGGETPDRLAPIATIPDAPSRGQWRGALPKDVKPASLRFTRVILTGADNRTVIGPSVPAAPGEERLHDPDMDRVRRAGDSTAQWTLPGGTLRTVPGPIPGRPGLSFVDKGVPAQGEIRGERIPVRPGESFVQSAWLRAGEGGEWGRRYLDATGKEVGISFISNSFGTRGWTLVEQRLGTSSAPKRHAGEQIPADTAFIEPVLRLRYNLIGWQPKPPVHLAGLSLRSLAPVADGPVSADPAKVAPDHLGPTESLPPPTAATDKSRTLFASFVGTGGVVAVSPESDLVVVGGTDGTLHFFDFPSGKELAAVHAHDDPILEIAVLPAKAGAYSVDVVGNVHLVTLQPPTDTLVACTARPPQAAVFTPDRKWVIFAASDPKSPVNGATLVEVIDLATGKQVNLFSAPGWFRDLWMSPDSRTMFLKNPSQTDPDKAVVSAWELPSFKRLPDATGALHPGGGHVRIPELENQTVFADDPARDRYVTVNAHGPLTVRSMKDRRMIWAFSPDSAISSLAVVPGDGTILVCRADGTLWRYTVPE